MSELSARARQVLYHCVTEYVASGEPVGSRTLSKKTGLDLLKATYQNEDEAAQKIASGLAGFYKQKYPDLAGSRAADIQSAGRELAAIYQRNVFPDLKVTWGTYANNLGHTDATGCFRCHDDSHAAADKKTITQDCGVCHNVLAVEETSPAVLKALGMTQ